MWVRRQVKTDKIRCSYGLAQSAMVCRTDDLGVPEPADYLSFCLAFGSQPSGLQGRRWRLDGKLRVSYHLLADGAGYSRLLEPGAE